MRNESGTRNRRQRGTDHAFDVQNQCDGGDSELGDALGGITSRSRIGRECASPRPHRDWRATSVEYLLVGRVSKDAATVTIEYELFDVFKQERILGGNESGPADDMRMLAHQVSVCFKRIDM